MKAKVTGAFSKGVKISMRVVMFIAIIALLGCGGKGDKPESKGSAEEKDAFLSRPGHLVIIGEDLSGTFSDFPPTTEDNLKSLCEGLSKSKDGGKVYFIGIGNASPKGYAVCEIRPIHPIDSGATVSLIKKTKTQNLGIKKRNKENIEQFLADAAQIFSQRNQRNTDINGFLDKASSIIDDPAYGKFKKWLFINSDGKQDTKSSNKVDCSLLSGVDQFFVSRGWKSNINCQANGKLLDTQHFVNQLFQDAE